MICWMSDSWADPGDVPVLEPGGGRAPLPPPPPRQHPQGQGCRRRGGRYYQVRRDDKNIIMEIL